MRAAAFVGLAVLWCGVSAHGGDDVEFSGRRWGGIDHNGAPSTHPGYHGHRHKWGKGKGHGKGHGKGKGKGKGKDRTPTPETPVPTTAAPATPAPTTMAPPTPAPTTLAPKTLVPTQVPETAAPATDAPSWECLAWRQTGGCSGTGPREPSNDKNCSAAISSGASGFCECSGDNLTFNCGQVEEDFNCTHVCENPQNFPPAPPPPAPPVLPPVPPSEPLEMADYMNSCGYDNKVAALTFDDGPKVETIDLVLDALKERSVKATFFITPGIHLGDPEHDPVMCEYTKTIMRAGHKVESHTWTHTVFTQLTVEEMKEELDLVENWYYTCIQDEFDVTLDEHKLKFFRPPGGAINLPILNYVNYFRYTAANWNVDTNDWQGGTTDEVYGRFLDQQSRVAPGASSIVLMHDWAYPTDSAEVEVNLVHRIIDYFVERDYTFVTMPECHAGCYNASNPAIGNGCRIFPAPPTPTPPTTEATATLASPQ